MPVNGPVTCLQPLAPIGEPHGMWCSILLQPLEELLFMRAVLVLVLTLVVLHSLTGCSSSREQAVSDPAVVREMSYAELALKRGDADIALTRLHDIDPGPDQDLQQKRLLLVASAHLHQRDLVAAHDALGDATFSTDLEPHRQLLLGQLCLRQNKFFDAQVHAREAAHHLDEPVAQHARDLEAAARSMELLADLDKLGADLNATLTEVRSLITEIHDPALQRSLTTLVN
jgi:hypothetical protein